MKKQIEGKLLRPAANLREVTAGVFDGQTVTLKGMVHTLRDTLHLLGFTEIHTFKIVHAGAEGGSNVFRLDYFSRKAYLAQSHQFYKQMMVGAYERIFEVAPVFRAEKLCRSAAEYAPSRGARFPLNTRPWHDTPPLFGGI